MSKPVQEHITALGRVSCLEIKCPRCKTRSVLHKAAFPRLDSSGFESYSFQCRNCGNPLAGIIDPFDGRLLVSVLGSASNQSA
jgi:hypothetical protein